MDRYYLYAQKETKTLGEIKVSVFILEKAPLPTGQSLEYHGSYAGNYTRFFVVGNELHFIHQNPPEFPALYADHYASPSIRPWLLSGYLGTPTDDVDFSYSYLEWNASTKEFDVTAGFESFSFDREVDRVYYRIHTTDNHLPEEEDWTVDPSDSGMRPYWYAPRYGPIVVTDDNVEYYDQRGFEVEFKVDPETGELSFYPAENLIWNPAFLLENASGDALYWDVDGAGAYAPVPSNQGTKPVYGNRFLILASDQKLRQRIWLRRNEPHHISFYAMSPSGQSSSIKLVVNPIDDSGDYLDEDAVSVGSYYDSAVSVFSKTWVLGTDDWDRYHAYIGEDEIFHADLGTPLGSMPVLPGDQVLSYEIRFEPVDGDIYLDAVQVHAGADVAPFLGIFPSATVEFEVDPSGVFIQASDQTVPHHEDQNSYVNVNPVLSPKPDGFLSWVEEGDAVSDFHLGKGGNDIATSDSSSANVLGRVHFPFSKTQGVGKLVERQTFHRNGAAMYQGPIADLPLLSVKSEDPLFPEHSYLDGSNDVHFVLKQADTVPLSVIFFDQFDNPLTEAAVEVVVSGGGSSTTTVYTDAAGRARFSYIPVGTTLGVGAETITFSISSVSRLFKADIF